VRRLSPNLSSNNLRTAGTKDVPPVRKTRSMESGSTLARRRASSRVLATRATSGAIHRSNAARVIRASISTPSPEKRNVVYASDERAIFAAHTAR
jgi:hypothetical protein